jgi:hypothetical protein
MNPTASQSNGSSPLFCIDATRGARLDVGVLKAGPAPTILYAKWVVPAFFHVVLEGLEKDARDVKSGLWSDPSPIPRGPIARHYESRRSTCHIGICGSQPSSV